MQLALSLFAVFMPVAAFVIFGATIWGFTWFVFKGNCLQQAGHVFLGVLLFVCPTLAMILLLKKLVPLFDFIGDVSDYLGSNKRREQITAALAEMVQSLGELAPAADIVVAGHSLGSVLVAHSALELPKEFVLSRKVVLLTMGSPLRLMSSLFPGVVKTPAELSSAYAETGRVSQWVNMWRDCDMVGRDLCDVEFNGLSEFSLGAGGHSDYWSDKCLWGKVITLLQTPVPEIPECVRAWRERELTDQERVEGLCLCGKFTAAWSFDLPIGMTAVYLLYTDNFWTKLAGGKESLLVFKGVLEILLVLGIAGILGTFVYSSWWNKRCASRKMPQSRLLGFTRLRHGIVEFFYTGLILLPAGICFFAYFAAKLALRIWG
jgi:hypothetical protein